MHSDLFDMSELILSINETARVVWVLEPLIDIICTWLKSANHTYPKTYKRWYNCISAQYSRAVYIIDRYQLRQVSDMLVKEPYIIRGGIMVALSYPDVVDDIIQHLIERKYILRGANGLRLRVNRHVLYPRSMPRPKLWK